MNILKTHKKKKQTELELPVMNIYKMKNKKQNR